MQDKIEKYTESDTLIPIIRWWSGIKVTIPVPVHKYVDIVAQYALKNCPQFVSLKFKREGLKIQVEKTADYFTCQWNLLANQIIKSFASKIEEDKCFLSSHDLHKALINIIQEDSPLTTEIIYKPLNSIKNNEDDFRIEFIPYVSSKYIENSINIAVHSGYLFGFLTSLPSNSGLFLNNLYSLWELSNDYIKKSSLKNRDEKLEEITALCKLHGLVIQSKQEFYETQSKELFKLKYESLHTLW